MRQTMRMTAWPNGPGWDVAGGVDAEVWRLATGLEVLVFTRDNKFRSLFIGGPSLDPITAVEQCKREGRIEQVNTAVRGHKVAQE